MPWNVGCERCFSYGGSAIANAGDLVGADLHCPQESSRAAFGSPKLVLVFARFSLNRDRLQVVQRTTLFGAKCALLHYGSR